MTATVYMVSRSQPQIGAREVDGVQVVIINSDSAANAKLNAAAAANFAKEVTLTSQGSAYSAGMALDYTSNSFSDAYPTNYFDTAVAVSAAGGQPGSGNLSADGDALIVYEAVRGTPVFVAGTSYTVTD